MNLVELLSLMLLLRIYFCNASWCGPCKAIAPYAVEKSQKTGIPLIKFDVDKSGELSQAFKISAMPTFLVVKGQWNNVIKTIVGGGQANVNAVFDHAQSNK